MTPLAIDLCCGLGGWTDGLLAEGYDVVGFDLEQHIYGEMCYPAQLVVQDVLTLHGSQLKQAALIVASPPCQFFSYTAMPWSKAKALAAKVRADPVRLAKELALFNACFRIQREACEATGRHIPMVVENVRGAEPWVGRARWNFGSFYLWGDVPALMPAVSNRRMKSKISCSPRRFSDRIAETEEQAHVFHYRLPDGGRKIPGFRFDGSGRSFQTASVEETGRKSRGMNWSDQTKRGQDFTRVAAAQIAEGRKADGTGGRSSRNCDRPFGWAPPATSSKAPARKAASAMIAKIPLPLARHIAAVYRPPREEQAA